jgi:hypothetical protein
MPAAMPAPISTAMPQADYLSQTQPVVAEDGYVFPPPPNFGEVWQKKSTLVFNKNAVLPYRCVKCNGPADSWLKRKLSWHHPALYFLIFAGLLVYVIIAAILSKRATVDIGLCAGHRTKRRNGIILGLLMFIGGIFVAIIGFSSDYTVFGIIGMVLIPVGLVWLIVAARVVTVKKIDDRFVWLNGINRDYLAALPSYPW